MSASDANYLKVIFIGEQNVGKTSIEYRAVSDTFYDNSVTISNCLLEKQVQFNDVTVNLQIWDTLGQEKYLTLAPMYYRNSEIALLVFSLTDEKSFDRVNLWATEVINSIDTKPILFLIGNKIDLQDKRVITTERGKELAERYNAIYYEVSAKTGYGIKELFTKIAEESVKLLYNKNRLHIKICEAQQIPNFNLLGKTDLYISLRLQSQNNSNVLKTKVISNSLSPIWNEEFDINVTGSRDVLLIDLHDENTKNPIINQLKIPVNKLIVGSKVDRKVIDLFMKSQNAGRLIIEVQSFPVEKIEDTKPVSTNTQIKATDFNVHETQIETKSSDSIEKVPDKKIEKIKNPDQISSSDDILTKEKYNKIVKHLRFVEQRLNQYEAIKPFNLDTFSGEEIVDYEVENETTKNSNQVDEEENFYIDEDDEKNHEVIKKLGEGATSIAYKIIDKRNSQIMCKKIIKVKEGQPSIKTAQNSLKESQVLHNINHPCICHSIGINLQEPTDLVQTNTNKNEEEDSEENMHIQSKENITTIAIFLELLEYKLNDCLSNHILSNTLKVKIAVEVAFAMDFLHKLGMIHRDLKIENIMLNSSYEAKVIDFELVHVPDLSMNDMAYSMTKGIGTFSYMSPEMQNEDDYDYKTDVYSYGMVLHVIFTGKLLKQKMNEKLSKIPPKLPNPSAFISKKCIELIGQCLSFDPKDRPSFEQILDFMHKNSFVLADEVDQEIVSRRYRSLKRFNALHIKSQSE